MPELPEVETVRRDIRPYLKGESIKEVKVFDRRNFQKITSLKFRKAVVGDKILDVDRRAKYLIFKLKSGKAIVIHLGMTGNILFDPDRYVKIVFFLSHGKKLYFSDMRLFGKIWLYAEYPEYDLGPEPLSLEFSTEKFKQMLKQHRTAIKPLLLNQKVIAGLGNIYAAEALFRAGIHPKRLANTIDDKRAAKLHKEIQKVLLEALGFRGTSVRAFVNASGKKGEFQLRLKVYDRKGKACYKCKTPIKRIVLGQRGTYYCPRCQK
ncbi:MAG: bifunctional DNA-formamidopyrimidine glycosylase/DNA-(apurinic or apyrimidinic site) lyase [Candidatus Margulisiibacteriota bacterium]